MEKEGEISSSTVAEYDQASKGKKLPERVGKKKTVKSVADLRKLAKKK
jgi:hypothetical protein